MSRRRRGLPAPTLVAEACRDEHRPEADELSGGALLYVLDEGAGIFPVAEAKVALGSNPGVDTDGKDDKSHDSDNPLCSTATSLVRRTNAREGS